MSKRLVGEPELFTVCSWRAIDDDVSFYWEGFCEGDKQGVRLEELTLLPEHFVGHVIIEQLPVCGDCGLEVFRDEQGWYCPSYSEESV